MSRVNPFRGKGDVKCELKILTHKKTFDHLSHNIFYIVDFFFSPPILIGEHNGGQNLQSKMTVNFLSEKKWE